MRILGLPGSLRSGSYNRLLLAAAGEAFPPGATLEIWEALAALPYYDQELEPDPPDSVLSLREAAAGSDALLVATPEYNSSLPGVLKNALDWLSRPFPDNALRNKPAAVIGASTGMFGAAFAQADAQRILARIGARVVEQHVPVPRAAEAFDQEGRLLSSEVQAALRDTLASLVAEVAARPVAA